MKKKTIRNQVLRNEKHNQLEDIHIETDILLSTTYENCNAVFQHTN